MGIWSYPGVPQTGRGRFAALESMIARRVGAQVADGRSVKNSVESTLAKPAAARTKKAQADGELGFDEVYAKYFHEVCRWVRALGGLEADLEDITQEVFIVVRRKLDDFKGGNLKGWLYRITQRTVRDYRRGAWFKRLMKRAADSSDDNSLQSISLSDPGDAFEKKEAGRWLAKILSQMSEKRRSAFILFEIEGYSGEEIADLEGVAVNTIWTRLHHARSDFATLVAQARRGMS